MSLGQNEEEPKTQTETEGSGPGHPPRRTAIGTRDSDPEPDSPLTLNWWQWLFARSLTFLLGGVLDSERDDPSGEKETGQRKI